MTGNRRAARLHPHRAASAIGMRTEGGQMAIGLVVAFGALLAGGTLFMLIGQATVLRADAVTAADAAALAAADDLRSQLAAAANDTAFEEAALLDHASAYAAAEQYASRNGATLVDFAIRDLDVVVTTATKQRIDGYGADQLDRETRGIARARARVESDTVRLTPAADGPEQDAVRFRDVRALADELEIDEVPRSSALRAYQGDGFGPEPSVSGLDPDMQRAILQVEQALGRGLELTSAYRSAAGQARVCAQVRQRSPNALCAPPGRSLHQAGLAIDVANPGDVVAALATDPSIELCQPFPSNDAVHFSHSTGRECGGRRGGTSSGDDPVDPLVEYTVRLVPLEG